MTRIVINARFLTQPVSGVQRYARELLSALDRRLSSDATLAARLGPLCAYYPAGTPVVDPPQWSVIPLKPLPGGHGHYWEQVTLARVSRGAIVVSLCGAGPVLCRNQLLVIHDANVFDLPEGFSRRYRLFHRLMRPRLARRVAALGTVSHSAAAALAHHLGVGQDRFAIISNSADHIRSVPWDTETLARYGLVAGQYLLTVGNQSPNKNIARLLAAYADAGPGLPPMVVAGGAAPGLAKHGLPQIDGLRVIGRVSDGELHSLYAGARAFVWPSRREGFGIPPLEAMVHDVPVLSSRSTAMPEILGDAALYFDPDSTADMAATLAAFLQLSPQDCRAMAARGRARVARYSWDASAERLITILFGIAPANPQF